MIHCFLKEKDKFNLNFLKFALRNEIKVRLTNKSITLPKKCKKHFRRAVGGQFRTNVWQTLKINAQVSMKSQADRISATDESLTGMHKQKRGGKEKLTQSRRIAVCNFRRCARARAFAIAEARQPPVQEKSIKRIALARKQVKPQKSAVLLPPKRNV